MTKNDTKKIALNWRWLKILLPLWTIFGGITLIAMAPTDRATIMTVLAVAFVAALAATAFCVKCFLFYLNEHERQKSNRRKGERGYNEDGDGRA